MGQRFKIQKLDEHGRRLPEESDLPGVKYVYALLPPKPGSFAAKNREKRRVLLKREDGTAKPWKEFCHYDNGALRTESSAVKAVLNAVEDLEKTEGYTVEQAAVDEIAKESRRQRMIANVFDLYKEHLSTTTSERTLKMR